MTLRGAPAHGLGRPNVFLLGVIAVIAGACLLVALRWFPHRPGARPVVEQRAPKMLFAGGVPFVPPGVAYQPRGFLPGREALVPSRVDLIEDLRRLRAIGFRSLVTYGAHGILGTIPEHARQQGFDGAVIMGIWDLFSADEWRHAVAQARFVDGYCLGNEGLGIRYSAEELAFGMAKLRLMTARPVTTSEPINSYLEGRYRDWLLAHSDWPFPVAQPFLAHQSDPDRAVQWIVIRHVALEAAAGKRLLLKEAGFPSVGPSGQEKQRAFFVHLAETHLPYFHFEAFDQPWKRDILGQAEVEAHWGLYRVDGTPKKVISWLASRWAAR